MCHMVVHRREKFPCEKCGKVLASRRMLRAHVPACVQGRRVPCPDCDWSSASQQGHEAAFQSGAWARGPWRRQKLSCAPHCAKAFSVKKSMWEHSRVCAENPDRRGHFTAGCLAAPLLNTPFPAWRTWMLTCQGCTGGLNTGLTLFGEPHGWWTSDWFCGHLGWGGHMYTCLGCTLWLVTLPTHTGQPAGHIDISAYYCLDMWGRWLVLRWSSGYLIYSALPVTCFILVFFVGCLYWQTSHIVLFHVCFGGCLASHCPCVSPGQILYILPKLATMSALCSWHVHCLGWVIWWLDRNRQGLLTESIYMCLL